MLNPEFHRGISEKVERGDVDCQALTFYLEADLDSDEFADTKAAIDEALVQGERGEGRPAGEVFADLRARYGVPRVR